MPLADVFSLGLTYTAIIVLRILGTPLILYNLWWSFKGFARLLRGEGSPTSLYGSIIFLMSLGLAGGNLMAFAGRNISPWSYPYTLLTLCLFLLSSGIAAVSYKLTLTMGFEKFYWLFKGDNLNIALRVAQMNELDRDYTLKSVEAAEDILAIRLAKKAVSSESS